MRGPAKGPAKGPKGPKDPTRGASKGPAKGARGPTEGPSKGPSRGPSKGAKRPRKASAGASSKSLLGHGSATAQDVLAWVTGLYTASGLLLGMTAEITGDTGDLPPETGLVPLLGLVLLLVLLALRLPSGAYSLKTDRRAWRVPLYTAGALALPAILAVQLRRRGQRTSPELWLTLPRWVCTRMALISTLVIAASAQSWHRHWPIERVLDYTALAVALAATTILLAGLGVRILARRELLQTPTALEVVAADRSLARQPLLVLTCASAALTVAPLLAAHLWLGNAAEQRAHAEAESLAETLLEASEPGREEELGELLAVHPEVGVLTRSGTLYGGLDVTGEAPLLELQRPASRAQRQGIVVIVPQAASSPPPLLPFALLALLCLAAGSVLAREVLREVDRDTEAARQRTSGARPQTREWRPLQPRIDALLSRTADTSITRYIAEEAVDEADRRRLSLMATIGGDLRPVLALLAEQTAELHRGRRTRAQRESLEAIDKGAQSLTLALGELIDMAALADGSVRLDPEPLPVAALLAAAVSGLRSRSPHLQVDLRCDPGMPPVCGDRQRLRGALERLLAFAGQQLQARPLTVIAEYEARDPLGIRLTISTPKRPMSPIKAGIARRPFHRLAGQPGLGLDLARADAVIRLSNGRLGLQSYGEGMRFTVDLPAVAPPPRAEGSPKGRP